MLLQWRRDDSASGDDELLKMAVLKVVQWGCHYLFPRAKIGCGATIAKTVVRCW